MKNLLLPFLVGALALPAMAVEPHGEVTLAAPAVKATVISAPAPVRGAAVNSRFTMKKIDAARPAFNQSVNPFQFSASRAAEADGTFAESFEGWDMTSPTWLPEGWTMESHGDATLADNQKWGLSSASPMLPAPSDGEVYAGISFATVPQDEWLITPMVTLADNMLLSFDAYIDPLFLFSLDNVNWNTMQFEGEAVVAATLQIMAKAAGDAEWTKIWDAVDAVGTRDINELMEMTPVALETKVVDLTAYSGKQAQFAFRYVGIDGNTIFIDNVKIGYPELDQVHYSTPLNTQYWGFNDQPGWGAMGLRIAQYGINTPITFVNDSPYTGATYSWNFHDPATNDMASSDVETLIVQYDHDYTSDFTTRNNMYYPVTLNVDMPGTGGGSYAMAIDYMQAGGRAEFETSNAGLWQAGLLPFEHNTDGLTYLSMYKDFGVMETPVTGYDENADAWWYAYTFPGETNPSYDAYVEGIVNAIYPSAGAPLMVEGAHVMAMGQLAEGANPTLQLAIYALKENGEPDFNNPLGVATCEAADMIVYNPGDTYNLDFYTIPFSFTEPIVLDDSHIGYIVVFSGYHASGFDYFAPVQSSKPNTDNYVLSYLLKKIKYDSTEYRTSISPLAYLEGEYGACFNSFAINLVAHYGWLECETEEVLLPADGSAVSVSLDSYHPAERLAVSELAGVETEVTGRYGNTVLTLRHNDATVEVDGNIKVSVPGHEVTIKVKGQGAGVDDELVADLDAVITGVYTIAGQALGTAMPTETGIYLVRYSDGTTRKLVVK